MLTNARRVAFLSKGSWAYLLGAAALLLSSSGAVFAQLTVTTIQDLIRFNPDEVGPAGGTGALVFYSDNTPKDALGGHRISIAVLQQPKRNHHHRGWARGR